MFLRKLIQRGGDSSTAIQAARDINFNGLSYPDARQLFLDLFEQHAQKCTAQAVQVATERATLFVENLLLRMAQAHQTTACADSLSDPGMQGSVLSAQRSYAASGEDDLGDMLVDLLVERATHPAEKYIKLVLTQAVEVAPLLSAPHWNALSVIFVARELLPHLKSINSPEDLATALKSYLQPAVERGLPNSAMEFRHILHTNTGLQVPQERLATLLANRLKWLAAKPVSVFAVKCIDYRAGALLDTCTQDRTGVQFRREAFEDLLACVKALDIPTEKVPALRAIMNDSISGEFVMEVLARHVPNLKELDDLWSNSPLAETGLTPVGIAIAQANLRRHGNTRFDVAEWVH
jgi:hypothetical protein